MAEGYPLDAESAGKALQRSIDELFSACTLNAFGGENERLLSDLGLAISYGVAEGDGFVECIRIANWNTKDLITIERSPYDASLISGDIDGTTVRITHQDMMGNSIQAPFEVNDQPVFVPTMFFALTDSHLIAPYIRVPREETVTTLSPDAEDCYLNNQAVLAYLTGITQLPLLLEVYGEFDFDTAILGFVGTDQE